jgi:acyl carrier protein
MSSVQGGTLAQSGTLASGNRDAQEEGDGMNEEMAQKVIAEIAAVKRIPVESITIDSTFEELAMDSLDAMNLLFALEEQFGVSIPDEAANTIKDVRSTVAGVKRMLAEKTSAQS